MYLKKSFYAKSIIILFFSIVALSACVKSSNTKEASAKAKPNWIDHPPQSDELLYFVGISTAANTLEDGQSVALNNALTKVSGFLGSKVNSVYEGYFTEMETNLKEQIKSKTSATVRGAQVVDSYHEKEKIKGKDKDSENEKFDVYVLVSFSKEEAQKELDRQRKEKEENVKKAYEYFEKGEALENEHKFYDARKEYRQGKSLLANIDELIELTAEKNSAGIKLKLCAHLEDMDSKLKRVALKIKVNGSDDEKKAFESSLASMFSKCGFTVSDEYPAFEVEGEVTVKESSFVMNSYAYYAEGCLNAIRVSDNQNFAVYPFKEKGFHQTREQAAMAAMREAGLKSGDELSKLIMRKDRELSDN